MTPPSAEPVDKKFSNENRGSLSKTYNRKIDKLVAGQVFYIKLPTNVEEIIDRPIKTRDQLHY